MSYSNDEREKESQAMNRCVYQTEREDNWEEVNTRLEWERNEKVKGEKMGWEWKGRERTLQHSRIYK